jgi:predicted Zn-dependent protease
LNESRAFAIRARQLLDRSSTDWVRATDIVMASDPSDQDMRALSREASGG